MSFDGSGSGNVLKFVYTFTYDNAGLSTKVVSTLDGKPDGTETYSWATAEGRVGTV